MTASECTVRLSGSRALTSSSVCLTSSAHSPGRPTIKSILILSNPHSLARAKACRVSSTVCFRPMRSSVFWFMVWGFTEILVTGCLLIAISFSLVILSGLPASTVYSFTCSTGKHASIWPSSRSSCSGSRVVGVPPPIYMVSRVRTFIVSPM